jgi:adenylate cyclase class IV
LVNQLKTARLNTIDRAKDINDAVTPLNYNEVLEKTVNDIYLRNFAQGLDSLNATDVRVLKTINEIYLNTIAIGEFGFSPTQMSQISQIAYQCPLKSAAAVYKAREMYAIDHPLANFDNYQLCTNQGIQYRIGNTENTNTINITQLANQLQIEEKGANDLQNYRLFNSLGQILLEWKSILKLQTIDIGTLNLSTGIYIIQAQNAKGNQSSKKFIYTK